MNQSVLEMKSILACIFNTDKNTKTVLLVKM